MRLLRISILLRVMWLIGFDMATKVLKELLEKFVKFIFCFKLLVSLEAW